VAVAAAADAAASAAVAVACAVVAASVAVAEHFHNLPKFAARSAAVEEVERPCR